MKITDSLIEKGFMIAGVMNLSVLIFSKFFTNQVIAEFDSTVLSNFGLLMIVVWGLAYMSVAKRFHQAKLIVAVFAIEKLIYGLHWITWHATYNVNDVFNTDFLAGLFYAVYGINDLLFFVFFTVVFFRESKKD